jgi:hypothetical protein
MGRAGLLAGALGLFLGISVWADPDPVPTLDQFEKSCQSDDPRPALTYQTIKDFVSRNHIQSPADFVAQMSKDADLSELLSTYVLMHDSLSSQADAVDADHPRVIFFKRGLILGVTDHPTRPDPRVEVIAYEANTHRYAFHQVNFAHPTDPFDDSPAICAHCHGSTPLPIWHTYRSWPGAYNFSFAYFTLPSPDLAKLTADQVEADREKLEAYDDDDYDSLSPADRKQYAQLQALFADYPRQTTGIYRHLKDTDQGEDAAALNAYLNDQNFRRIGYELETSPDFGRYQYAFLGALLRCDDLPSFLGPAGSAARAKIESAWGTTRYTDLVKEVDGDMRSEFAARLAVAKDLHDENAAEATDFNDEDDIVPIAGLRYLFEKRGIDVKRFSFNFEPREPYAYGFSQIGAGYGGLRASYCYFFPPILHRDPSLTPLLTLTTDAYADPREKEQSFCAMLKARSLAALGGG